jgi:serine/threonine protein kinase
MEARAMAAAVAVGAAHGGSAGVAAAATAARRADASTVVLRIFDALDAAHAAGVIHCDVRPSNVVIARDGRALLIDFGSSRAPGADARAVGVAAYADARIFCQGSFVARRAQDVAGALYTWLAAAFGAEGVAPWLTTQHERSDLEMLDDRAEWLVEIAARDAGVARVAAALRDAEDNSTRSTRGAAAVFASARAAVAAAAVCEGPA